MSEQRLIDANVLKEEIIRLTAEGIPTNHLTWSLNSLMLLIKVAPTIEAEPVRHGGWYSNEDDKWACSDCDCLAIEHPEEPDKFQVLTDYCPHCGARMDKEEL